MLVDYLGDYLATIDRTTQGDKAAALKYASTIAGLNNTLKLFQGQLDGFAKMDDPVGAKRAREDGLKAWLAGRGDAGKAQTAAIAALEQELAAQSATRDRDQWLNGAVGGGLAGEAVQLYRSEERRVGKGCGRSCSIGGSR